jgi:hypothetical protein
LFGDAPSRAPDEAHDSAHHVGVYGVEEGLPLPEEVVVEADDVLRLQRAGRRLLRKGCRMEDVVEEIQDRDYCAVEEIQDRDYCAVEIQDRDYCATGAEMQEAQRCSARRWLGAATAARGRAWSSMR